MLTKTGSGVVVAIVIDAANQKVDPPSYVSCKSLVRMPITYQGLPLVEYRKEHRKAETDIRSACLELANVYAIVFCRN